MRGTTGYRTPDALFARQRCAPALIPCVASYPRPDSNRHWTTPQIVAAANWATRACALGAEDSNLYELLQRQPCCRLHQLPLKCAAKSGYRESNPDLLHGEQLH